MSRATDQTVEWREESMPMDAHALEVLVARLEGRVTTLEHLLADHHSDILRLEGKFDSLVGWLRGVVGGLIVACVMLAINLATRLVGGG